MKRDVVLCRFVYDCGFKPTLIIDNVICKTFFFLFFYYDVKPMTMDIVLCWFLHVSLWLTYVNRDTVLCRFENG